MVHEVKKHFSGTVRTTKDDIRFGPLSVMRSASLPANTEGRNGDLIIVDDTAESDERTAINRVPSDALLCQKVPLNVIAGDFTITTASGVFTITINSMDDVVPEVRRAEIPGLSVSIDNRGTIVFETVVATFADVTTNFVTETGIGGGPVSGRVEAPTGTWQCISFGGFASYATIVGDVGSVTATVASETITYTGEGLSITAVDGLVGTDVLEFDLDISDLPAGVTVALTDEIGVDQGADPNVRFTFTDVVEDLDIPFGITANGFVVRTAADTYASRTITVAGSGDRDGLSILDGGGVGGNPEIGLDIEGLPVRSDAIDPTDRVPVWNTTSDSNEYYTVGEIATALAGVNSFETWARAGNGTGGSLVADNATDTVTLTGGDGIFLTFVPASDTMTISFARDGLADTAVEATDTIPFFDGSNSNEPEYRSFTDIFADLGITPGQFYESIVGGDGGTATAVNGDTITFNGEGINITATDAGAGLDTIAFDLDISDLTAGVTVAFTDEIAVDQGADPNVRFTFTDVVEDLDIPHGITTNGLITRTAADTYASRTITPSGVAGDEGISVVDGDGVAGNPTIGLDITGLTSSVANLTATDELAVFNGTNNLSYTGQQIADGVIAVSGILSFSTITGGDGGSAVAATINDTVTFNGEGINITATNAGAGLDTVEFDLDISDLTAGTTVALTDEIAVDQGADPNVRFTFTDVVEDLDIPFGITANGFVVRTAADTYASRTITINGAGALDGLAITNGDGIAGDPLLGLDIQNLPALSDAVDGVDRVAVWNSTAGANEYITIDEINSFHSSFSSITGDTGTATADTDDDTFALIGATNGGITTIASDGPEQVTFSITPIDLTTGGATLAFTDFIIVSDAGDTVTTIAQKYTFDDVVNDLNIPHDITANGLITRTADDTYASRTITGTTDEIDVANGNGVAGNPTIGIADNPVLPGTGSVTVPDGTTAQRPGTPVNGMLRYNTDEACMEAYIDGAWVCLTNSTTPSETQQITGADGATSEPMLFIEDSTRANKQLSVETTAFEFVLKDCGADDWLRPSSESIDNALSGFILPYAGTVVRMTVHGAQDATNTKNFSIFIDGTETTGVTTLTGASEAEDYTTDANIDFAAGTKLRVRARNGTGGDIKRVNAVVWVKWRVT